MQAVITVTTVILGICLAKIVQQHLSTTDGRLSISGRFHKQLAADILFSHRLTLHELIEFLKVFVRIESDAEALATIASCTSCLLVIAFQRFRNVIVDDETHIGFVDTHTKGDSGNDHIDILHEEVILRLCSCGRVEACMIGSSLNLVGLQHSSKFFHLLS